MDTRNRHRPILELVVCAAVAVGVLGVPIGVGIWRSMDDDPQRDQDYVCIIQTGDHCPTISR